MHPTLVHRHHIYMTPTPSGPHPQTDLKRMECIHTCGFIKYHDCDYKSIHFISFLYYFNFQHILYFSTFQHLTDVFLKSTIRVQCILKFSSTMIFSKPKQNKSQWLNENTCPFQENDVHKFLIFFMISELHC